MRFPDSSATRRERDALGELDVPGEAYYGIHTLRAARNFPLSGYRLHRSFLRAMAQVKRACAETNTQLGYLDKGMGAAIAAACREVESGALDAHFIVDPFQGGAGTSTNMNLNEVVANRAAQLLAANRQAASQQDASPHAASVGEGKGTIGCRAAPDPPHPLRHVNMHQSTNDVYPTALRVAALDMLGRLEEAVAVLQESLQERETALRDVVKVARTELTDAVPMTLGMTFGAFAEAVARDRWRIFKCRERLKRVNLGGTAIGTGLGAPRDYILLVAQTLRQITGLPVSRAENLVDATQNMDIFVEISGMLKAHAANLMKIASDLRLLASGPATGIHEITLPPLQAGSSIMAGKINPVLPEAATQVALQVMGNDQTITLAASMGQLELNHLLPLLTHNLLESLTLLTNLAPLLARDCISGIRPNRRACREHVERSSALATVLVPGLGYERVEEIVASAARAGRTVREELMARGVAESRVIDELLSPNRLCRLGFSPDSPESALWETIGPGASPRQDTSPDNITLSHTITSPDKDASPKGGPS